MTDSSLWLPLLITLVSLVTTLAVFWAWSKRAAPAKRTRGTRIVTDAEGNNVRRSTRSRKSVTRWSPDDLASPTGMSSRQAQSPGLVQKAADATANGIAEVTPKLKSVLAPKESPVKRGKAAKAAAASPEEPAPPVVSPRAPRSSRAKAKA